MIGQGVAANQFTYWYLCHHTSSGSSLLFLTMAEKTLFDSGLNLGWSSRSSRSYIIFSAGSNTVHHSLLHSDGDKLCMQITMCPCSICWLEDVGIASNLCR